MTAADGTRRRAWRAAVRHTRSLARVTAPLRPVPDFLIVGAQRCGTTSLHRYLLQHPAVLGARFQKGVHWFDEHYDRPLSWYRANFPTTIQRRWVARRSGARPVAGESSPYYLFHPHAPRWIGEQLPEVRLIALLRDPVERAWSHYQHNVARGMEPLGFAEALDAEPDRLAGAEERLATPGAVDLGHRRGSYVARGRYLEQLERVWAAVPAERVLVLFTADLDRHPAETLARAHEFLGVPVRPPETTRRWNQQPPATLPGDTRERLEGAFAEADRALAERLGLALPWGVRP